MTFGGAAALADFYSVDNHNVGGRVIMVKDLTESIDRSEVASSSQFSKVRGGCSTGGPKSAILHASNLQKMLPISHGTTLS
eukprot:CAMPEP_0170455730 /NCGR_PEP_ID=MMETSP0123-20130129/3596_1 /TAXON_ID=182087 /ORGANISM="Favella ehrenbergii, Strain Fehren 1" /LENGTH=80 /DNA_ID=CAMNT_0010718963 /DNA_START=665 /DNA_END=907 /DNA_ORIENTATION=+